MHALALSKAANGFDYSVILEDDSIFNVDDFYGNVKKTLRFLDGKENSVVFFSEPSAVIFRTIEDVFQFYKGFLRVVPPMSKGASAYMLKRDLALNLSDYILKSKLTLPIDLLINYWAQENKIRTYWKKTPYVTEGSGNIYSSSLR
jgi:GR25 family glycosyltransferase involved in LPS biosynthesis